MEYPPAPYVFPTTQRFDGDDGPWSTFKLAVGTPEQHFRILPSLASSFIWLPRMGACNNTDLGTCADARGIEPFLSLNHGGFEASQSSSWARISLGEFSLNLGWLDIGLLYGDAYKEIWSYIGTERISFQGGRQKTGFTVNNSLVAGYVDEKIKLGMIGLTTNKFDLQREREIRQFTSMLGMLAGADGYNMSIPSESYSYTAGASYRKYGFSKIFTTIGIGLDSRFWANLISESVSERFGSLILGGYDEVIATRTRVPFTVQKNRDLVVVVQGIVVKARTDQSAMSTYTRSTFDAVIDTTLPYLWLPEAVCDRFQSIFNLVFDDDSDLYTINETAHNLNMANNPTVIITLSDPTNSTERVSIEIPYRAFFLEIPSSIRTNASHYFPIRRSENQIRFTLGRTLLQESYIIVDYEHDQFSITQVDWSSRNTGNRSIVPIHKRGYVPPKPEEDGLSTGAILGIVVGLLLSVLLVALLIWLAIRRRRTEKDEKEQAEKERAEKERIEKERTEKEEVEKQQGTFSVVSSRVELPAYEENQYHRNRHQELEAGSMVPRYLNGATDSPHRFHQRDNSFASCHSNQTTTSYELESNASPRSPAVSALHGYFPERGDGGILTGVREEEELYEMPGDTGHHVSDGTKAEKTMTGINIDSIEKDSALEVEKGLGIEAEKDAATRDSTGDEGTDSITTPVVDKASGIEISPDEVESTVDMSENERAKE